MKGRGQGRAYVSKVHLNRLIAFLKSRNVTSINEPTRNDLAQYQQSLAGANVKPNTLRDILGVAVLLFQYLCDYGHIETNPASVIDPPRRAQSLPRPILTEEEFQYLLNLPSSTALLGLRDRCIFQVLYASAMRTGELCQLNVGDVSLEDQQILIRRPKNRRDRIVHIDHHTAQALRRYLDQSQAWSGPRAKTDPLFFNANGRALNRNSLSVYFGIKYAPQLKKKWGKVITLYSLRHTSATDWLDSAARCRRDILPYVQRQLGHEDLNSTAIYTHVAIEPLRQMFKRYHPRELQFARQAKIPNTADAMQDRWKKQRKQPPTELRAQGF